MKSLRIVRLHWDTVVLRKVAGLHSEVRILSRSSDSFALLFCEVLFAQRIQVWLSFRSETSVVIKWIDQHQVHVHVVLAFEKVWRFKTETLIPLAFGIKVCKCIIHTFSIWAHVFSLWCDCIDCVALIMQRSVWWKMQLCLSSFCNCFAEIPWLRVYSFKSWCLNAIA